VIFDLHVVNAQGGVCHVWTTRGGPEVKAHTLKKNHLIYLCLCMYAVIFALVQNEHHYHLIERNLFWS
jgi:hypothetical protein